VTPSRVTVGVVLLNAQGEILMQLRDDIPTIADPGCWAVPGGGQDSGESFEQAARREFLEETGYRLGTLELVCERDLDRGGGQLEHQVFFRATYDGRQPLDCREGQKLEFLSPDCLSTLKLTPDLESVIQRVLRGDADAPPATAG
jgi:8-oxo-dGTP diphosphatase